MLASISKSVFEPVCSVFKWLFSVFVVKSAGVRYIKHSCGLITHELSVSVKAKLHFDIITHYTHTAQTRQPEQDEFKDVLKGSAHSELHDLFLTT